MTGGAGDQGRLDLDDVASPPGGQAGGSAIPASRDAIGGTLTAGTGVDVPGRVVRVMPDVAAVDRVFDYLVPSSWEEDGRGERLGVGSRVRVVLAGRRVGGWVVEDHVVPPDGVDLRPLARLSGMGPSPARIDRGRGAAPRWVGPVVGFLATASPPTVVEAIPAPPGPVVVPDSDARWMTGALDPTPDGSPTIVRLPPATDPIPLVLAAARRGDALVLVPTAAAAARLATRVRRSGIAVATMPRDWARAAAGGMVIGSRAAALAPVRDLRAVVVLDEHDEAYQEERAPTWNARDLVVERARRAGVPCVLASASPTLEALAHGRLLAPSRAEERTGWPVVDLLDRRLDDPVRSGLFSPKLVPVLRGEGGDPVVCVLNRKGRSRLLACDGCGELARCEEHRVPMVQDVDNRLRCPLDDDHGRPVVCDSCGATRFRNLRAGVSRVREELEALAGRPVLEVTAETDAGLLDGGGASVFVGTEAVLHRIQRRVARVVFLEFDQELLAPRMRASEQAMALLVRASRLLGPRSAGGRLVVQTRQPDHEVLQAVLQADPGRLVPDEKDRRSLLGQPPFAALARVSGAAAPEFMTRLGSPDGIDVMGPRDGSWLVRAPDHDRLSDALLAVSRPAGRLRLEVDPRRA
ncbi:MAG: hypothetical protein VX752_03220 [Actinomycetota bacterium]|nr:hypothetical protein [Actinomycetota bacterium]